MSDGDHKKKTDLSQKDEGSAQEDKESTQGETDPWFEPLKLLVEKWKSEHFQRDQDVLSFLKAALDEKALSPKTSIEEWIKRYDRICEVAKLREQGKKGKEIAELIRRPDERPIAESQIAKMHNLAKALGVLRTVVNRELIPPAHGLEADLSKKLTQKLGVSVRVFQTPKQDPDEGEAQYWKRRIETMADCAAPLISDQLSASAKVGIAWGTTLWILIAALSRQQRRPDHKEPLTVIPMAGEMVGSDAIESRSCSALADKLASAIRREGKVWSLRGIPSFISTRTEAHHAEVVRKYFQSLDAYSNVVEMSKSLDTILTSVGTHHQPQKLYIAELKQSGIDTEVLQTLSCGDIGGVLLEERQLSKEQQSQFAKMSEGWLGMPKRIYHECAKRARENKSPGVMVIALAKNKARVLRTCIDEGLVTRCFIDTDLAEEL